ncbi:MAG TPA: energy transducer TonB [Flavisolibacter sp.]|jgi:protein TonB
MTSNEILQADVLDIIFDNRNKQYGAYALRKNYNFRMGVALAIAISSMALAFLLINPSSSSDTPSKPAKTEYEVLAVQLPEDLPQPETPPPAARPTPQTAVAQQRFIDNFRITDNRIVDPGPTHIDLTNTVIGSTTTDGPLAGPGLQPPPDHGNGGTGNTPAPVQPEAPFVVREQAAHFPGGMDAWLNFLRKHLETPGSMEPGEKRTVVIRFQVSAEGTVTGFEVVQSAGSMFDKEVIRVLKKMPKWMPAIQNGHAVSVSFTQPVTFVAEEN